MYGDVTLVAGLARIWTHDGSFYDKDDPDYPAGTNPEEATVTTWLTNLSAQMDIALGSQWFNAPITSDNAPGAYNAISQYIAGLVSDLVHRANGVNVEVSPQGKILQDMTKWVKDNADGLLAGGATQKESPSLKTQARFRTVNFP
jgi:hypothetical protein